MNRFLPAFLLICCSCREQQTAGTTTATRVADTITATPALPPVLPGAIPAAGEHPEQFAPAGYAIQYQAEGDINSDGLADAAIVLRATEDSTEGRALAVLVAQAGSPRYRLADAGWNAIGPQYAASGYPIRYIEELTIEQGDINLKLSDPGPSGNLSTIYRYMDREVRLVSLETFNQGAGGASRLTKDFLTGKVTSVEINRMKDPEETSEATTEGEPRKILLHDSNPEEFVNGKDQL
jgi:hypothetical protein